MSSRSLNEVIFGNTYLNLRNFTNYFMCGVRLNFYKEVDGNTIFGEKVENVASILNLVAM